MIIVLKNADFSASNIGTLSTWRITRSLGSGATYEGPTSVDKGAALSATVTIAEGYELTAAGVTVTMGGTAITAATVNENIISIYIASVTGNVTIKVPTVNVSGGDEPEVPDEPTIINYNLLKTSECQYEAKMLDDGTANIESSTDMNIVSGWIPVTYGKYYGLSAEVDGVRDAYLFTQRVHLKLDDGTVIPYMLRKYPGQNDDVDKNYTDDPPFTYGVDNERAVAMRFQLQVRTKAAGGSKVCCPEDVFRAFKPMIVEGDTLELAHSNAISFSYMDGDA